MNNSRRFLLLIDAIAHDTIVSVSSFFSMCIIHVHIQRNSRFTEIHMKEENHFKKNIENFMVTHIHNGVALVVSV